MPRLLAICEIQLWIGCLFFWESQNTIVNRLTFICKSQDRTVNRLKFIWESQNIIVNCVTFISESRNTIVNHVTRWRITKYCTCRNRGTFIRESRNTIVNHMTLIGEYKIHLWIIWRSFENHKIQSWIKFPLFVNLKIQLCLFAKLDTNLTLWFNAQGQCGFWRTLVLVLALTQQCWFSLKLL